MKVVIDMNSSIDRTAALQEGGVEAVHWSTIGPQDAADDAIMAWARANQAVVLTRNLDFGITLTRQARVRILDRNTPLADSTEGTSI
ncbi:MAG: DUF5615 family PIN-like protein [Methylorubrum populi]